MDRTFAALADATRRAIVSRLLDGDATVSDLAAPFDMSLAAVSKHIRILTEAGLVTQRAEGRVRWCRLDTEALQDAAIWMESFGRFARLDLDRIEELVDLQLDLSGSGTDSRPS
ncbi:ArsR/SmtB family transcription factor [Oceanomicrobium pacificus]|nr:metalloregulator ArsR/SmtB family transcription factor [Oceanomicrobium pacificus]